MTNTEREALREAARFAAVEGPYSSALFEATCAGARVNFRDLATPAVILSLLDDVEQLGRSSSPVTNAQVMGIEALHKKASSLIDNDSEPDIAALISHIPALCASLAQMQKDRDYWQTRATEAEKAAEKWYHERY